MKGRHTLICFFRYKKQSDAFFLVTSAKYYSWFGKIAASTKIVSSPSQAFLFPKYTSKLKLRGAENLWGSARFFFFLTVNK